MSEIRSEVASTLVVGRKLDGRCIYSAEGKRALIEASLRPGVSVAKLAMIHGVNANLLRKWIVLHQGASAAAKPSASPATAPMPALLPVIAIENRPRPDVESAAPEPMLEIVLGDASIRLRGSVDAQQLRLVIDCLARRA